MKVFLREAARFKQHLAEMPKPQGVLLRKDNDLLQAPPGRSPLPGLLRAGPWLLCLQFFLVEALATLPWRSHYSYRDNYISDLGAALCERVCSPWHACMNASFVAQGVLIATGTLLLPRRLLPGFAGVLARVALVCAALGVLTVGIAPEDVNMNVHLMGARTHFLAGTLAMLCAALALPFAGRRRTGQRDEGLRPGPALLGFAVAAFGDALLVLGNAQTSAILGSGTTERLAAYPLPLWLAWTGASLARAALRGRHGRTAGV